MTKVGSVALLVCVAVVLTMSLTPSAGAGKAKSASGSWTWENTGFNPVDVGDGCQYFTGSEEATWTGTFRGTSHDDFAGIQTPDQSMGGALTVSFIGKVGHVRGRMFMHITFWSPITSLFMDGTWAIKGGSGGLTGVHGKGTWVSLVDATNKPLNAANYAGKVWTK